MQSDIRLIVFDINRTLIAENSWARLNVTFGMTREEDEKLWRSNAQGKLPTKEWTRIINGIYHERGLANRKQMEQALFSYAYLPGARETIEALQQRGYDLALLSGSPDPLVAKVARELGIVRWAGNGEFVFDHDGTFVDLIVDEEEAEAKLIHLRRWQDELGIGPKQIVCIGDGDNDDLIFDYTNRGVTFTHSAMSSRAWKTVEAIMDTLEIFP